MKRTAALPKPIKSKNPVVILKHVIKAIEEEPKRYDQGTFIEIKNTKSTFREDEDFPGCGTICCVAGWTNIIAGRGRLRYSRQERSAQNVLGLTECEADELFDGSAPGIRDRSDVTPEEHAADGIKHIKRFVLKKWGKRI